MQVQAMGNRLFSKNEEARYQERLHIIRNLDEYFTNYKQKLYSNDFSLFTLIGPKDQHRLRFQKIFENLQNKKFNPQQLNLSTKESRGIAVMLGMAICDALGASTEFHSFKKQGYGLIKNGFSDIFEAIKNKRLSPRHGHTGVWTDDASMGLAMAYSLMLKDYKFDAVNTRYMFHLWLEHGLGNGGRDHSIGLGGNISISMREFRDDPTLPKTAQKNKDNNGNGSLMRLAPIPVTFCDNLPQATKAAEQQSLTTHNGLEAKQCSRLMTQIIIALIHRNQQDDPKQLLIQVCDNFHSDQKSVLYLAQGKMQTQQILQQSMQRFTSFQRWNKGLKDRNWNWRDPSFTYSPTRTAQYSGYAGSYCMDGLAMALHMVYFTNSFKQCAVRCADMGGDCDTVGSIAGQIAGAIYGIDSEMLRLYSEMEDYLHGRYEVFLVAYKLVNRIKIDFPEENKRNKGNQEKLEQKEVKKMNQDQYEGKEEERFPDKI